MNPLIIILGKQISRLSHLLNIGHGSTWPGHIALKLNKNFIKEIVSKNKIKLIFVVGTNGKTTTSKLIETILKANNKKILINSSGANLLNGIASSLIIKTNYIGKMNNNYAIFEIDENSLPEISRDIEPDYLIVLNLFRDQLDRYGEINTIISKWKATITNFKKTVIILNADDPQIAYLGKTSKLKTYYFGLNEKNDIENLSQAADSVYCPHCNTKLNFERIYFSHLGKWSCPKCKFKRPNLFLDNFSFYPLEGTHIKYDTLAAVVFCTLLGIPNKQIEKGLRIFKPAFGRQEEILYKGKRIKIFLSKNPTSFNETLSTIKKLNGKNLLIVLNDRIPDGLDTSWIWDIDFESLLDNETNIFVWGDRKYEMSLRLKYAEKFNQVMQNFNKDLDKILKNLDKNEILYLLPNYSAMLDIRKIITGKKIL